jgi:hypothetical protein
MRKCDVLRNHFLARIAHSRHGSGSIRRYQCLESAGRQLLISLAAAKEVPNREAGSVKFFALGSRPKKHITSGRYFVFPDSDSQHFIFGHSATAARNAAKS